MYLCVMCHVSHAVVAPHHNIASFATWRVTSCESCNVLRLRQSLAARFNTVTPERGVINVYHLLILVNAWCSMLIVGRRGGCDMT